MYSIFDLRIDLNSRKVDIILCCFMVDKNKEAHARLRSNRMKVGIIIIIVIELPLILLLSALALNDLISFFVYYVGLISTGIGGMFTSLAIANAYVKKKQ
jgi:hypothetical protein